MRARFYVLRDDLAQDQLLGEVLGAHHDVVARPAAGEQRGYQERENRRSIQLNPPSERSASRAAGIAPARICVLSTDAMPRKMKTPRPPPPMAAAMAAGRIALTETMRTPAMMVGAASGSCTSHSRCSRVIPIAIADSRTAASTPKIPASVLRRIGSSA